MCPAPARRQHEDPDPQRAPRASLGEWLRAWREVVRDPDKEIPPPALPPEGVPLPEELNLHCPDCGYNPTGLKEWRCPECGERFSPRRAYTLGMLKRPEYFLRYRYGPTEIRAIFWALALFVIGAVGLIGTGPQGIIIGGAFLLLFFGIIVLPSMILLRVQTALSWPRFFFWLSVIWFLVAAVYFWPAWFF